MDASKLAAGKLRFRSTPWALVRVCAARPSGLPSSRTKRVTILVRPDVSNALGSAAVAATPSGSLPWIPPIHRTLRCPVPKRCTRSGRPSTEYPMTRQTEPVVGVAAADTGVAADEEEAAPATWVRGLQPP